MQCARCCHDKLYPSEELLHRLNASIVDGKLPKELVPHCPVCGSVMEPWVKSFIFQYGSYWEEQAEKYKQFKAPFMRLTAQEAKATYVTINLGEIYIPEKIRNKSFGLDGYLSDILKEIRKEMEK